VYQGLDNGALPQKDGVRFLNQITQSIADRKEQSYQNYSDNNWIADDIGFAGVQKIFEDQIAVPPAEGEEETGPETQLLNNRRKVELYDDYMNALETDAASYGVTIGDLPTLNEVQKNKLYAGAQAKAKSMYLGRRFPELATMPDIPNKILTGGELVQGMAGPRDLIPDVTTVANYTTQIGSDGYMYRLYPDGLRQRDGVAPLSLRPGKDYFKR